MKNILGYAAGGFAILGIIFYLSSIKNVYGIEVANVQATVFCGASFLAAVVCFTGSLVLGAVEDKIEKEMRSFDRYMRTNFENKYNSAPKMTPVPVEPKSTSSTDKAQTETIVSKKENTDAAWVTDGTGQVICPGCGSHMTVDYIRVRKKCPDCGYEYHS